MKQIAMLQREVNDLKEMLSRLKPISERRRGLFGTRRTRSIPVEVAQEPVQKSKSGIQLEELLPLLPHLSGVMPQLKNQKVAEAVKILSNPAVASMLQQFVANGGLGSLGLKPKQSPPTAGGRR